MSKIINLEKKVKTLIVLAKITNGMLWKKELETIANSLDDNMSYHIHIIDDFRIFLDAICDDNAKDSAKDTKILGSVMFGNINCKTYLAGQADEVRKFKESASGKGNTAFLKTTIVTDQSGKQSEMRDLIIYTSLDWDERGSRGEYVEYLENHFKEFESGHVDIQNVAEEDKERIIIYNEKEYILYNFRKQETKLAADFTEIQEMLQKYGDIEFIIKHFEEINYILNKFDLRF